MCDSLILKDWLPLNPESKMNVLNYEDRKTVNKNIFQGCIRLIQISFFISVRQKSENWNYYGRL